MHERRLEIPSLDEIRRLFGGDDRSGAADGHAGDAEGGSGDDHDGERDDA